MGHQALGVFFGCEVSYAKKVMHGKISLIYHDKKGIFKDIPSPFKAVRYHSLIIKNNEKFSEKLEISAWTLDKNGKMDEIMGIRSRDYQLYGVQFHPESVMSEYGDILMRNFLSIGKKA